MPAANKRKLPDNPPPEVLKKMRAETTSELLAPQFPSPQSAGKPRKATVEDADDDDVVMDFAPGGDADYFVEEDDEGRFFGGGLTSEQKDILNIFDSAGDEGALDNVRTYSSQDLL